MTRGGRGRDTASWDALEQWGCAQHVVFKHLKESNNPVGPGGGGACAARAERGVDVRAGLLVEARLCEMMLGAG